LSLPGQPKTVQLFNTGAGLTFLLVFDFEPGGRSARMLCGLSLPRQGSSNHMAKPMTVEIAFWLSSLPSSGSRHDVF
jgi:hypothetical protein